MLNERNAYRRAVASVIRKHRKAANLTTADVAMAWGCDPSNVRHAEAGRKNVSMSQLSALCAITGRKTSDVLDEVERLLQADELK